MPHPTAWQKYSAVRISVIAGEVRDFANEIEVRWVGGCVEKKGTPMLLVGVEVS